MAYTTINPVLNFQALDVASVTKAIKRLGVDDQLGLLWFAYTEMGKSITPAAPGAARLQFAEGILNQIKEMSHDEQLEVMRSLVRKQGTPITRAYGVLTANTKLAFWYQLAELMQQGVVVGVPANYKLSADANSVLVALQKLDFSQQITVLRNAVVDLGVDPLG